MIALRAPTPTLFDVHETLVQPLLSTAAVPLAFPGHMFAGYCVAVAVQSRIGAAVQPVHVDGATSFCIKSVLDAVKPGGQEPLEISVP